MTKINKMIRNNTDISAHAYWDMKDKIEYVHVHISTWFNNGNSYLSENSHWLTKEEAESLLKDIKGALALMENPRRMEDNDNKENE